MKCAISRLGQVLSFRKLGYLALAFFVAMAIPSVYAQNSNTGEIKGTVSDSTGAVLGDVNVTITNVQTGVKTLANTNSAGIYDVPSLLIGQYTITFSKAGFRSFVREGLTLQIQTLGVDATLQVGAISEEVVVNAEAQQLETETSDQHVDLSAETIRTAPIVGTDWRSEMIQLIPGANTGGGTGMAGNGQQAGINGTQGYNINFLLDGSSATAPRDFNSSNNILPIDSMSEVSVNSSNAPAQYGNGLTSINVITKSGTNQWHGSAYEFIQNTAFNARGFYNQSGTKSVEHWNDYGASLGGPILKNKLFFFFNYQRNPSSSPTSGLYSYPTAAMQAGDFYGMTGATGPAFDANGILQGTYDPVAIKLQAYFPSATAPGWISGCPGPANVSGSTPQTCSPINNYVFNGTAPNTSTWYTGRVDYDVSSKHRLSFTFNYYPNFVTYVPPDPLYPNDASSISQAHNYNLTGQLTEVYTINSRMINEFRIGALRELDKYRPPSLGKGDPTKIGLQPAYGTNSPSDVFPKITIDSNSESGCYALGAGCGENGNIDSVLGSGAYNVSDVVTLVHGKHTIKVGGEFDKLYQNYTGWGDITSGNFEFNGGVTGIPYADFLAGDVYGWYVYEYDPTSAHAWTSAVFGSDDYKITPRLTLNLGLRWQIQSGWGVDNNLFGVYDPFLPNPAEGGLYDGAILFGGQTDKAFGGKLSTIQNADYKEFAPRIGFAWSPRDKWSVRASYGIFDAPRDAENYTDGALGLGFNPHNEGNGGYVNGSSAFPLSVGPPPGTVIFPDASTLSSTYANFSSAEYYPRNMPTVYVQQLLFSVQRELPGNLLIDTSYVYTRGTNLNFATDINQAPASALGCTGYNCGNPNPIFNSIGAQYYTGWSNYNALQIRLQKRMSRGLSFQFNYAWSKSLDTGTGNGHGSGIDVYQNAYSPAVNYGLSDFNSANTFVGSVVYELPFGHGRQFALRGPLDQIAGGWRLSSIFQWHGGIPFTPVVLGSLAQGIDPGLAPSLAAGSYLYPVQIGDPRTSQHSVLPSGSSSQHSGIAGWFNPSAYAFPSAGTFGNAGRNSLTGPGFADVDISIAKEFRLYERLTFEIRGDGYNAFNHVNYNNPDNQIGSATVGQITAPAGYNGSMRVIQLGGHFRF
jgi:outer membrane receptor protein involved in Fe transport